MKRSTVSIVVVAIVTTLVSSCAIPDSGEVSAIDPDDIPYELNATTTAAPTTTVAPTTTSPMAVSTTSTSTTVPVEVVDLFFVAGTQLVPISRLLLSPAVAPQVIAALAEGVPQGDAAAGLRTALPADFVATVVVARGVATVDLPASFITNLPGAEQRLAIAQIVLTMTRRAGVGQVTFTTESRAQSVPRGRGDLTEPGGAVACDDYANLLPAGYSC
ncbi:MAG: GerMN domain-containing protein [Ilumatobacteraceae bacterium]